MDHISSDTIKRLVPHRYPMLLIDKILMIEKGKTACGVKNVSGNDGLLNYGSEFTHYSATLLMESMAQLGGMIMPQREGLIVLVARYQEFIFEDFCLPGDQIVMNAELLWQRKITYSCKIEAMVNDSLRAKGNVVYAYTPI